MREDERKRAGISHFKMSLMQCCFKINILFTSWNIIIYSYNLKSLFESVYMLCLRNKTLERFQIY